MSPPRRSRASSILHRPQFWVGAITLLIACGWYAVFMFDPMVKTVLMSLQRYNPFNPAASPFIGLAKYSSLMVHERFVTAVSNTLAYTLALYVISIPLALLVSWSLTRAIRTRAVYQFIVFLPVVASVVAVSLLFRMLMNPQSGALNTVLGMFGLPGLQWIYGSEMALISVVLLDSWRSLGFYVVLLTAAMLAVPSEQRDAARVDGAGEWTTFWYVVLPSIMPTLAAVSILTVLSGLQAYVTPTVFGPGPGTSTLMINEFIIEEAFSSSDFSSAAAASVLLFLVMLAMSLVQLRFLRSS
jgi:ABC-type sugar transport system permease subunit